MYRVKENWDSIIIEWKDKNQNMNGADNLLKDLFEKQYA